MEDEFVVVKFLLRVVEEVFYMDDNVDDELIEGGDFMLEFVENVKLFNLLFIVDKLVVI